ncbi:lysozyme inhibitor LprI family protein [Rossellomorea sp. NPDC077527]|uniref:lysozyme inhibitor LprI family protein n=1 Tax=Rossellomorea sp. NPDC077527 TaxID=3364510 RepID=UPI0037C99F95
MKKHRAFILATSFTILLSACSQSSGDAENHSESESVSVSKEDPSTDTSLKSDEDSSQTDFNQEEASAEKTKEEEPINTVTKIEGKQTYIERLDNIQKELDAMPDKKDSDKGVTNAMKNYYGVSYEKYDDALNEIYALLKKELSPEVMAELKTEQLKWIEEKKEKAEKERLKYEGGTFEYVAWYISLYESTKDRCYELVEEYMTN